MGKIAIMSFAFATALIELLLTSQLYAQYRWLLGLDPTARLIRYGCDPGGAASRGGTARWSAREGSGT